MSITGILTQCVGCDASLGPHNVTRLCAECKHIARNRRLGGPQYADTTEPVTRTQAIATIVNVLDGHVHLTPARYGGPCACGKAAARVDTGLCEWCTATFVMLANDP